MNVTIQPGFSEDQRSMAAALYYEAFRGKLHRVFDPPEKAEAFFAQILDPRYAISALDDTGTLLGIAGFKTAQGALTRGTLQDVTRIYGRFGGLWRALFASLLERDLEENVLLMDGICVSPHARGFGVGTRLLKAIKTKAHQMRCKTVRLDVIDTNPRAQALYIREGFVPTRTESLGPLSGLFGFSKATRMEYAVTQQNG